jgi:succinylarginine dihydrolase
MNFDGLVGPTHNYAGLSHGNVASKSNALATSRPRAAVLQGLEKMAFVASLGVPQGFLPPLPRPHLGLLRSLGFSGTAKEVLSAAQRDAPKMLNAAWSASSMWTANAATITASRDTADGRMHFTAANLSAKVHRFIERSDTAAALQVLFPGERFVHHTPLPAAFGDEGAANHTRLSFNDGSHEQGLDVFVWGKSMMGDFQRPVRFPARQALEASQAIARRHGAQRFLFLQQAPRAIDAGAFHNDVVSVGQGDLLLAHQHAFADPNAIETLKTSFAKLGPGAALKVAVVSEDELSLDAAVKCYLFNSQIVSTPAGPVLIAPSDCKEDPNAAAIIARWVDSGLLAAAHFLDVKQSMRNGGGPACLRLRVPLTSAERADVHPGVVFSPQKHEQLKSWAQKHYREELHAADLADPGFARECEETLDALTQVLGLGSDFYTFQRA